MTVKIPVRFIRDYTRSIDFYYIDHEIQGPPMETTWLTRGFKDEKQRAEDAGELEELKAVIDLLLSKPNDYLPTTFDTSLAEIIQDENLQDEDVLKDLLRMLRSELGNEPSQIRELELVDVDVQEWRRQRAAGRHNPDGR